MGSFDALTYTGSPQTPVATVTLDGNTVTGTWSAITNVGETSTFTANGNYTGTISGQTVPMSKKQADAFSLSIPINAFSSFDVTSENLGTLGAEMLTVTYGGITVGAIEVSAYANGKYTVSIPEQTADGVKTLSVLMSGVLPNHLPHANPVTVTPIVVTEITTYQGLVDAVNAASGQETTLAITADLTIPAKTDTWTLDASSVNFIVQSGITLTLDLNAALAYKTIRNEGTILLKSGAAGADKSYLQGGNLLGNGTVVSESPYVSIAITTGTEEALRKALSLAGMNVDITIETEITLAGSLDLHAAATGVKRIFVHTRNAVAGGLKGSSNTVVLTAYQGDLINRTGETSGLYNFYYADGATLVPAGFLAATHTFTWNGTDKWVSNIQDPASLIYTVTFQSNGGSAVAPINNIASGSTITRPADPVKTQDGQELDFIGWYKDAALTDDWNFTYDTVTGSITLYAKWSGWQAPVSTDSRFATGYPKATTDGSGKIVLTVKMASAAQAEVFMVVNQANAQSTGVTSTDVIHGHGDRIGYIDEAPYLLLSDTEEHVIETDVAITANRGVKIYFVVRDSASTTPVPVMLEYAAGAAAAAVDIYAPTLGIAYINQAKTKVILYFHELLDTAAVPDTTAFRVTNGTESVQPTSVAIPAQGTYDRAGVVELAFNAPITLAGELRVHYTQPATGAVLQDTATVPNKVASIDDSYYASTIQTVDMTVDTAETAASANGQYIHVELNGAPRMGGFTVTLKYGADEATATEVSSSEYNQGCSISGNGDWIAYEFALNDEPTLITGHKYFVTWAPGSDTLDFAGDAVTNTLTEQANPSAETLAGAPASAVYNATAKTLTLTYAGDTGLIDASYACFFTVSKDGVVHNLRGRVYFGSPATTLYFDTDEIGHIPEAFWTGATLSFGYTAQTHTEFTYSYATFTYPSGMPYEGFSDLAITVTP